MLYDVISNYNILVK